MKAILIVYNQALTEKVEFMLDKLEIKGFTRWEKGVGGEDSPPMMRHFL